MKFGKKSPFDHFLRKEKAGRDEHDGQREGESVASAKGRKRVPKGSAETNGFPIICRWRELHGVRTRER